MNTHYESYISWEFESKCQSKKSKNVLIGFTDCFDHKLIPCSKILILTISSNRRVRT